MTRLVSAHEESRRKAEKSNYYNRQAMIGVGWESTIDDSTMSNEGDITRSNSREGRCGAMVKAQVPQMTKSLPY